MKYFFLVGSISLAGLCSGETREIRESDAEALFLTFGLQERNIVVLPFQSSQHFQAVADDVGAVAHLP
jgi:hypothetical protein